MMRFNPFTGHDTVRRENNGGGRKYAKMKCLGRCDGRTGTGRLSFSPVPGVRRSECTTAPAEGTSSSSGDAATRGANVNVLCSPEPETSLLNQAERNVKFHRLKRRMRDLIRREIKIHAKKTLIIVVSRPRSGKSARGLLSGENKPTDWTPFSFCCWQQISEYLQFSAVWDSV